jgi:hypothetical protein
MSYTKYPIQPDVNNDLKKVDYSEKIKQSLLKSLGVSRKEILFSENIGSFIQQFNHEPNDAILQSRLVEEIRNAVNKDPNNLTYQSTTFEFKNEDAIRCLVNIRLNTTQTNETIILDL